MTSTTTHELAPGESITTLEVRPDRRPMIGIALSLVALLLSVIALAIALRAAESPAGPSSTQSTNAAAFASHRGGRDVVRHKARTCYTLPTGKRLCTVRWIRTVRDRSTLEDFRSRYA